jgi:hypothetical protein
MLQLPSLVFRILSNVVNFQKICEAQIWEKYVVICREYSREDRSHVRAKLSENYRAVFYSPFYDPTFDKLL